MPNPVTREMEGETRAKFRVFIAAPPETVWTEITRTDRPIPAFFNTQMHLGRAGLAPGSKMAMRTINGKYTGVVGEILEADPPRRFVHTFKFTNHNDPECKMVFELQPAEGGTQFTLTIEDIPVGTKSGKQMVQGGTMILGTLKATVETGKPSFGTRMLFGLFKIMEPISPKQSLSERWPVD